MAATYDPSALDPDTAAGRRYIVRLLIADNSPLSGTTVTSPEFDDDEIDYFLDAAGDAIYPAAIAAARSAVAKYSKAATSRTVGDLSIEGGSRAMEWRAVLASLKQAMVSQDGINAISNADLTDGYEPVFTLGAMDNPRLASDETTSTS